MPKPTRANRTVAISNSFSPEIIWGLGGPEEDPTSSLLLDWSCRRTRRRGGRLNHYPTSSEFLQNPHHSDFNDLDDIEHKAYI